MRESEVFITNTGEFQTAWEPNNIQDITLIYPKGHWVYKDIPYPPLGIGYIASSVSSEGYETKIIDGQIFPQEAYERAILEISSPIVGISGTLMQLKEANRIGHLIKQKTSETILVFGGSGPNCLPPEDFFAESPADILCQGEGELTMVDVLRAIGRNSITEVPGLIVKDSNKKLYRTAPRALIKNLDRLPSPAWELFPLEDYLHKWEENAGFTSTNLIPSRGCPFKCNFCDHTLFGRVHRSQSPEKTLREMQHLKERYEVDDIFFFDDLFVCNKKNVIRLCQLITETKFDVSWSCQARADLADRPMLEAMNQAGCAEIYFGVEAGTDRLLKWLNKGFTLKQVKQAFTLCHETGINPGCYFIVGIPGETREDIDGIMELIKEIRPSLVNISFLTPFPGTPLYEQTKDLIEDHDYSQWDDVGKTVYNCEFEVNPEEAAKEILTFYRDFVRREGIPHDESQFLTDFPFEI